MTTIDVRHGDVLEFTATEAIGWRFYKRLANKEQVIEAREILGSADGGERPIKWRLMRDGVEVTR